ncbi:hypothetical protein BDY21DRAFT_280214 [Lineolata rhizophorae]|uniref:Gylcosyl hydrolase 115 C-terminal domain-containing protein n=1 Tax=Lineolata rhizophorae TaxID=578093 RepID=A0A6A6PA54_9PEZI|nr:hypothetical protein BDY21DRAFT_280214 [Lineolata rhizophorae]
MGPFWLSIFCFVSCAFALGQKATLSFDDGGSGLQLGGSGVTPEIILDSDDWEGVIRTANDLAADFGRVLGSDGQITTTKTLASSSSPKIIAGTIGKSALIDSLVSSGKIDVSGIEGQWETFLSQLVADPMDGESSALVIAGSDKRGTIYGLYDISEQIGVSPWYWWADVPPKQKSSIYAMDTSKTDGPPSVKYRGLFLNDEQPALTNWVNANYGQYNVDFYSKVFELLLRNKANYLWPTMWNNQFYNDDPQNGPTADMYGIVMGTSHTEPMARADKEKGSVYGGWNWGSNQQGVKDFMRQGVERAKDWETLWTLGMRGNGDNASPSLTAQQLEEVIAFQQDTLRDVLGVSDLSDVPMMWCLYKEVGGYFDAGMDVPDDITLLWSDDNVGNIQRLPTADEVDREGGAGVYYHFDYVGDPRNYKWINTIQLSKTWEQLNMAHKRSAKDIWIFNVGDLKPLELPLGHALSMAYDMSLFSDPASTDTWLRLWATREFGASVADATADIMATYGQLIVRRKYELLDETPYVFSTTNYNEAEANLAAWEDMLEQAQSVYDSLDSDTQTSFFEMVLHPVLAGKTVEEIYAKAALNGYYAQQGRTATNEMADDVSAAGQVDSEITSRYHSLLGGKWNHMMDQVHLGYTYWQDPGSNSLPSTQRVGSSGGGGWPGWPPNPTGGSSGGILGVSVEGSTASAPSDASPSLLPMDPYMAPADERFLDIYTRSTGSFDFSVTAADDAPYVTFSPANGTLSDTGPSQARVAIAVDWAAAPAGSSTVAVTVSTDGDAAATATLSLPLENRAVPADFAGFVESGGAVSIEPGHWSAQTGGAGGDADYAVVPRCGRTRSCVTLLPPTAGSQAAGAGPGLAYDFYAFAGAPDAAVTVYLAPSFNVDPGRRLAYAVAVGGEEAAARRVEPVEQTTLGTMPSDWMQSVKDGARVVTTRVGDVAEGRNTLRLWALEPGVVFTKVVLDLGGVRESYLGPPESLRVGM